MAKDPALLFYPSDWLSKTMGMTFEEKGAYIHLLMMQFNVGHMTTHMIYNEIGELWNCVKHKFEQDENGLWYNERLEIEKEKRRKYSESRRNNIKGNNQHKKTAHMDGHMTSHMVNINSINTIVESNTDKVSTGDPKIYSLQHCKEIALRDQNWVQKNRITPQAIDKFIDAMLKDGDYEKTPLEFKKHCRRWLDKQKQEEPTRKLKVL